MLHIYNAQWDAVNAKWYILMTALIWPLSKFSLLQIAPEG